MQLIYIVISLGLFALAFIPAWWLAERFLGPTPSPFFRLLTAIGFVLVGYLMFVNLLGRATGQSILPASLYFAVNAIFAGFLVLKRRPSIQIRPLIETRKQWSPIAVIAVVLAIPQWILAISTPYWDEVTASSIHITAANQFAENVFPPRHNAFPALVVKYHYGFTLLSGSIHWLTGLTANASIDVASTGLWLFTFLFIVFWLMELGLDRWSALWGGFASLYGGGLAWLYSGSVEVYEGNSIAPTTGLLHQYRKDLDLIDNAVDAARMPSMHLRNIDGSLSHLPWDISAQVQQHAVMLGIALTVLALFLFVSWQIESPRKWAKGVAAAGTCALVPLGHAVLGGTVISTAGILLFALWVRERTWRRFLEGLFFGLATVGVAIAHGGFFETGPEYGSSSSFLTLRHGFGYFRGGVPGFLDWNIAGFGIPLFLAVLAWVFWWKRRNVLPRRGKIRPEEPARRLTLIVLTLFTAFSYLLPQFAYYAYTADSNRLELLTEISKFFFAAHLGFALLSAYGVVALQNFLPRFLLLILGGLAAVTPMAFIYANTYTMGGANSHWLGFYHSPYGIHSIEQQMGEALLKGKQSPKEVYFDASADERGKVPYLNELLIFGGSLFTLTPSNYERDGLGFRLSTDTVARRLAESSRVKRLQPGAAEASACSWYYGRPEIDLAFAPVIVRSRFQKLVNGGYFSERLRAAVGGRVLYRIEKPTQGLDEKIEQYWQPRIVSVARGGIGGGKDRGPYFYDYVHGKIITPSNAIDLPEALRGEFAQVYLGRFSSEKSPTFLIGKMLDTDYHHGSSALEIIEKNVWSWSRLDPSKSLWTDQERTWSWDTDVPLVANLDGRGEDSLIAYRPTTGEWFRAPEQKLAGPKMEAQDVALPFTGRFLKGTSTDLALWSARTGRIVIQNIASGERSEFSLGGQPGQILMIGDFNGDGRDEVGLWDRADQIWSLRLDPKGPLTKFRFGTVTSVPVPADYDGDGRVDVAYWEPSEGKIYVSFNRGRTVGKIIPVPPGSIPALVNYE